MMKLFGNSANKKLIMAAIIAIAAIVVLFSALVIFTYANDSIFPGVSAGKISLSGKTEAEAVEAIDDFANRNFSDVKINVNIEDFGTVIADGKYLEVKLSSEETARAAYAIGHEGSFGKRIGDVVAALFGARKVPLTVAIAEDIKDELFADVSKYDIAPVDGAYTIEDDKLILHPRSDGKMVDKEEFFRDLSERFISGDMSDMNISRKVAPSVALDIDKVYSEVHKEVADAYLEKGEDGNRIVPHVLGMDFDLEAAREKYNANPDSVIEIPLTITEPKIYTKHLEVNLFKYELVEVETHFSPKKVNRTANVRLAAKLINGTILNPGEEFSYNKTVGPRTRERGFLEAGVFASGEVVDGIGGGICQVSSTLYMAALRADMKITERRNHAFYVDYAPKGEDATVVWGAIDFRFVNTSKYPIKIVATSKNNYIRIQLMGTEPDEVRTVKLTKKTHSTSPFPTREKPTDTLALGKREVTQEGQPAVSMTVYRNVYDKKGKLIESYVENTSKYKPMPEIVLVGTGPATETVAPPQTDVPETPETPDTPVAPENPENPEAPETPTEPTAPEGETTETPSEGEVTPEAPSEDSGEDTAPDWITQ